MATNRHHAFPMVNLMPDREHAHGVRRPLVRARFLVALAGSLLLLIIVVGIEFMPSLVVPR